MEVDGGVAPAIVAGDGGSVPRSRTSTEGEGIGLDPDPARVGENKRDVGGLDPDPGVDRGEGEWGREYGEWGVSVTRVSAPGG